MADNPHKNKGGSGDDPDAAAFPNTEYFAKNPVPDVPASKPLQWFLFFAFVLTGAAYVVGIWTEDKAEMVNSASARIREITHGQPEFAKRMLAGDRAANAGQYDLAIQEYRLALLRTNAALGHQRLGEVLIKQRNANEGFDELKEALVVDPACAPAADSLSRALVAQGRFDESARVLRDTLEHAPNYGLLHYDLAETLLQTRVDLDARRRLAADSGNTKDAATAEAQSKSIADEALKEFAAAEMYKYDSAEFWWHYGTLLNETHQYALAEKYLIRAIKRDGSLGPAHFQLGIAEARQGQYAGAIEHYNKVLSLMPDDPNTLIELATVYATATNSEVRSPKMAVLLAVRATDATTSQITRYMDTLARCYAADGDFFQAIAWENKAIHRATQLNDVGQLHELQARVAQFMEHHQAN